MGQKPLTPAQQAEVSFILVATALKEARKHERGMKRVPIAVANAPQPAPIPAARKRHV